MSDITDLSELPPSTTTISTVAVQSGRSKVILAILRVSKEFIVSGAKVKIASMYYGDSEGWGVVLNQYNICKMLIH